MKVETFKAAFILFFCTFQFAVHASNGYETAESLFKVAFEVTEKIGDNKGFGIPKFGVLASKVSPFLSLAVGLFDFISIFLPKESPEMAFMNKQFKQVFIRFDQIQDKLEQIEDKIEFRFIDANLERYVGSIRKGIGFYKDLTKDKNTFKHQKKSITDLKIEGDLNAYIEILHEGTIIQGKSIFQAILDTTHNGCHQSSQYFSRIMKPIYQGLLLLGFQWRSRHYKPQEIKGLQKIWSEKVQSVIKKIQHNLQKCNEKIIEQAQHDIQKKIEQQTTNRQFVDAMAVHLEKKFPEHNWIVFAYNNIEGFPSHCITGQRIDILHQNGKNVVVFYIRKDEKKPPKRKQFYHSIIKGVYDVVKKERSSYILNNSEKMTTKIIDRFRLDKDTILLGTLVTQRNVNLEWRASGCDDYIVQETNDFRNNFVVLKGK